MNEVQKLESNESSIDENGNQIVYNDEETVSGKQKADKEKTQIANKDLTNKLLKEEGSKKATKEKVPGNGFEKAKSKVSSYLLGRHRVSDDSSKIAHGKNGRTEREKQEALQFMCGIMDECTHLKNFSLPVGNRKQPKLKFVLLSYL